MKIITNKKYKEYENLLTENEELKSDIEKCSARIDILEINRRELNANIRELIDTIAYLKKHDWHVVVWNNRIFSATNESYYESASSIPTLNVQYSEKVGIDKFQRKSIDEKRKETK